MTHLQHPGHWGVTLSFIFVGVSASTNSPTNYYQMNLKKTCWHSSGVFLIGEISSDRDVWSQVCPWLRQVWEGHWVVVDVKLVCVCLMSIDWWGASFQIEFLSARWSIVNYCVIWEHMIEQMQLPPHELSLQLTSLLWQLFWRCLYDYKLILAYVEYPQLSMFRFKIIIRWGIIHSSNCHLFVSGWWYF